MAAGNPRLCRRWGREREGVDAYNGLCVGTSVANRAASFFAMCSGQPALEVCARMPRRLRVRKFEFPIYYLPSKRLVIHWDSSDLENILEQINSEVNVA
jgi:hypothetical protein